MKNDKELDRYINELINELFADSYQVIKLSSPYELGILRSAIKVDIRKNGFSIYVDEKQLEVRRGVNYMPYTNEVWTNRTGTNPNQYWWNRAVTQVIDYITLRLGGKYENK